VAVKQLGGIGGGKVALVAGANNLLHIIYS
jgi:hypothetical protein